MRYRINELVDDLAKLVFLVLGIAEIEIAAVMAEAVVLGIHVLPRPILSRQLAVLGVQLGDVVALVVTQRPVEALARARCANLNRLQHRAIEQVHVLVRRHEDAHLLGIPIGIADDTADFAHVHACLVVIIPVSGAFGGAFADVPLCLCIPSIDVG